jgi:hydrogenase maturation factor HypF (carbamoyltransferase family)
MAGLNLETTYLLQNDKIAAATCQVIRLSRGYTNEILALKAQQNKNKTAGCKDMTTFVISLEKKI